MPTNILVQLPVSLTLVAPVLSAGGSHAAWGVDTTCYRDWSACLALPGNHVKGKLREAMRQLHTVKDYHGLDRGPWSELQWFGNRNRGDTYLPERGRIKINDFRWVACEENSEAPTAHTRIRIHPTLKSADAGALVVVEQPHAPGCRVQYAGLLEFFAPQGQVDSLVRQLQEAFCLVTSLGAEKTIGWGRLEQVSLSVAGYRSPAPSQPTAGVTGTIELCLSPQEPLLIGGAHPGDNLFTSEKILPGTAIKGALATGLNRLADNPKPGQPIDAHNRHVAALWPNLARHFGGLRFLHAVPSTEPYGRPLTCPRSFAFQGGRFKDLTFETDEQKILARGAEPVRFQIDWKSGDWGKLPPDYQLPDLQYHNVTRTAIQEESLRADDSQLYAICAISPKIRQADKSAPLFWNSMIVFPPELTDPREQAVLAGEIEAVLPLALRYVGKRQCTVENFCRNAKAPCPSQLKNARPFAIILQTPAIMIDPEALATEPGSFDSSACLRRLYEEFWGGLFGPRAVYQRHYAGLEWAGGVVGMQCRQTHYRPFLLTQAGSVFVFQAADVSTLGPLLEQLLCRGLPLPAWAIAPDMYGSNDTWRRCPYVPENGYGEIRIATI